ncbi:MAG: hypothetical protein LIO93_10105, partial [Bacteroidales bacterium]|nr:hypothetical protein [Bacteroidales bacterium]
MKHCIFLFFCVFVFLQAKSDNYYPIGTTWYYTHIQMLPIINYVKLEVVEETEIDGKMCMIVEKEYYKEAQTPISQGKEYIYVENNKLYRYLKGDFHLLYDFDAALNDVFRIYIEEIDDYIEIKVDEVSVIEINGIEMKKFHYETIERNNDFNSIWHFDGEVIEKIGNLRYFFPQNELHCDAGCPKGLRCYTGNDFFYKMSEYE